SRVGRCPVVGLFCVLGADVSRTTYVTPITRLVAPAVTVTTPVRLRPGITRCRWRCPLAANPHARSVIPAPVSADPGGSGRRTRWTKLGPRARRCDLDVNRRWRGQRTPHVPRRAPRFVARREDRCGSAPIAHGLWHRGAVGAAGRGDGARGGRGRGR